MLVLLATEYILNRKNVNNQLTLKKSLLAEASLKTTTNSSSTFSAEKGSFDLRCKDGVQQFQPDSQTDEVKSERTQK